MMAPRVPENNRENLEYAIRGYRIIQELSAENVNALRLPEKTGNFLETQRNNRQKKYQQEK